MKCLALPQVLRVRFSKFHLFRCRSNYRRELVSMKEGCSSEKIHADSFLQMSHEPFSLSQVLGFEAQLKGKCGEGASGGEKFLCVGKRIRSPLYIILPWKSPCLHVCHKGEKPIWEPSIFLLSTTTICISDKERGLSRFHASFYTIFWAWSDRQFGLGF